MASKFQLDKRDPDPVKLEFRGLVFYIKGNETLSNWNKVRAEQMTAADLDPGEVALMSEQDQCRWFGKATATVFIADIEPFEVDSDDGSVTFMFNEPSEMTDVYETQGQELMGENVELQNDLFNEILRIIKHKPDYEVRALGKSSQPADSGE